MGYIMAGLTAKKIIEIHDEIIKEYGGTGGILNEGTLELLVYKVNRENNIFNQTALILYTIASQHPFFDGNKRTALVTAEKTLYEHGYFLQAEPEQKVALMQRIAKYECCIKVIQEWVEKRAKRLHLS